ncbi:toll, putative [Ixodes scapularis]|uniref:Toll, putative n=1 Tax=Ixodes scapularis TaxID=6945 RepID=B7PGK0_IXOSC|nr:toll, putative [Ixodes scapularis]|eukprot:XP_002400887.1 toll, putative [Ixodes scapularis]
MPRVALLPALLWVLTSWALDVTTAWRVREAHSHSKTRNLDSVYMNPQSSVALRVGAAGTLLSSWILNDCNIQHFSDGGLLVTGHKCEDIPIVNMTSWPVPATEIALYHTSVTSLQPNAYHAYGPISQVTKLEIIQNKIYAIKPHAFNGFPNVTFLSLSDNPIKFLSSESFRGLDSLKVLVLFRTRLHEFSTVIASVNPGVLPKLEILNLGNTALHRIDEHDLVPMENSSLKHIQFHLCDNLAYIHPQALKPLKHLEGFYLRDNLNMKVENIIDVISNITQETFRIIDVSQPVYKAVPYRILESVARTAAEVIIFIRMTDYTVTKDSFPPMNRVKCLVLESGKIREFKANALQNLPNLEEVSFRRNLFLGVPPGLLAPRIKFLDLSGYDRGFVQLDLPDYVFSKMVNLREIAYIYDAFVSYSNSDTQWVISRLLPQLECSTISNLKLCVYDRDFVAGRNISECILDSIKHSRKIILVLSNSFLQSPWCRTDSEALAAVLEKIVEVDIEGKKIPVQVFRTYGATYCKGVIYDIHTLQEDPQDEVLNLELESEKVRVVAARRLGKTNTAMLTFDGDKPPRSVLYGRRYMRVFPYMPKAVTCANCHRLGHKPDICPTATVCATCGNTHSENQSADPPGKALVYIKEDWDQHQVDLSKYCDDNQEIVAVRTTVQRQVNVIFTSVYYRPIRGKKHNYDHGWIGHLHSLYPKEQKLYGEDDQGRLLQQQQEVKDVTPAATTSLEKAGNRMNDHCVSP